MNLVIDAGNSRIKTGLFDDVRLTGNKNFASVEDFKDFLRASTFHHVIVSSVSLDFALINPIINFTGRQFVLSHDLPLPILNRYATPATLGVDRIAGACGAWSLFPNQSSLVIDVGTCINYEWINEHGEYLGGAISPGVVMRFESMHEKTSGLPLASANGSAPLTGNDTLGSLQSGVMNGILEEIKGVIQRYKILSPDIRVILCGGDSHFFENDLKPSIFVAPELVLMGLNSILIHNVKL